MFLTDDQRERVRELLEEKSRQERARLLAEGVDLKAAQISVKSRQEIEQEIEILKAMRQALKPVPSDSFLKLIRVAIFTVAFRLAFKVCREGFDDHLIGVTIATLKSVLKEADFNS